MLNTLIESKRTADRRPGGAAASVVVHAVLIVLVVVVTAQAKDQPTVEPDELPEVIYLPTPKPVPPATPRTPLPEPDAPPVIREGIRMPVLSGIPDELPPIHLSQPTTNPDEFLDVGSEPGRTNGIETGTPGGFGAAYSWSQVEKQTQPVQGNPKPIYPSMLESAGVDGEVVAQFVVDTSGLADMSTFEVLEATNELFVDAVKRVLPTWHFYPAEIGGHKVKQLVQMRFTFTVP